jgi:hypothetical protein
MLPYIYKPLDFSISPPSLTMQGLQDSVFTIANPGEGFGLDTTISVQDGVNGGLQPTIQTFLQINSQTSKVFSFTDTSLVDNTKFYHILYHPSLAIDIDNLDTIPIIEYTYNTNTFTTSIIQHGSIPANVFEFNQILFDIYTNYNEQVLFSDVSEYIFNNNNSSNYLSNVIGYKVASAAISSSGAGYKLDSTFFVARSYWTSVISDTLCELSCQLCVTPETVSITGGTGYVIGDTFTIGITSSETDIPAQLVVTQVNSSGGIVATFVNYDGLNFKELPSVVYDGSTGSGATINVYDSFGIKECSILNPGNGYTVYDHTIVAKYNNINYLPTLEALINLTIEDLNLGLIINNNFSLGSISVLEPGNNISDLECIIQTKQQYIVNNYLTFNMNNIISIKDILAPYHRPRFLLSKESI